MGHWGSRYPGQINLPTQQGSYVAETNTVFDRITTRYERQRVFQNIIDRKAYVSIFTSLKKEIRFYPQRIRGQSLVGPKIEPIKDIDREEVIAQFLLAEERYFMKTVFERSGARDYQLSLSPDLFRVQRRDNFRLRFPEGYKAYWRPADAGVRGKEKKFVLSDLSGGGFAVDLKVTDPWVPQKGQVYEGVIHVGENFVIEVQAQARYVRSLGSAASGLVRGGFQFNDMPVIEKERLITKVLEIHRALFSKFAV